MKRSQITKYVLPLLAMLLISGVYTNAFAKKAKLRLSAQYINVVGTSEMVQVKAKAKGEDGMQAVAHVEIGVYREFEDTSFFITTIHTNADGVAEFDVALDKTTWTDTSAEINYLFEAEAGEWYKSSSKSVTYSKSKLMAKLETIDSMVYITASLIDARTGEPISDEGIKVRVKRLFSPLTIGKDMYYTDEDGTISVPYNDNIPGKNKVLVFEIVLQESDMYGTVIYELKTDLGAPVVMKSTFDQRTMWSPRAKTPYWLLIFPNLIIFGIWFTIVKLVYNLFKISKS